MARVTVRLDGETLAAIRRFAGPRGVSAFLRAAARERVARLRFLGLLDALHAEHGAPDPEIMAGIDADARQIFGS